MSYDTFTAETTKDSCEVARTKRKIQMAVALSVANGLIQVTMSVLRLGIITIYLSEHLVSGFTCGAAFHVLTSQIPKLLGINVKRYSGALALVYTYIDLFKDIITINWATFVVSLCCTLFLIAGKEINARFHDRLPIPLPWELAIVILSTIVSYFGYLNQKYGVEIVEEIPTGIETSVPVASDIGLVFLEAIPIAIVAFAIEISLSQMFAVKHSYKIDSDQELLALGIGNIFGSFFSCFPTAASLSRSVIWEEVGAHSQITGLFSSVWILIILLWIGPLFESLPQAALAVIIVVNLKGLLKQFEKIRPLWKVSKLDALSWIVTWSAVVFLGVSLGLGVAVAFGLFTIVLKSQRVRGVTLVAVGNGDEYRDVQKYQTRFNNPKAVVFSFPGPIMFANKKSFQTQITKAIGFDPTMQTNTSSKRQKDNEVRRRSSEIDDRPFIKESSQNNNVSNSPSTSTPLADATVFVNTHDVKNHKPAVDDIKFPANPWSVGHGSGNQIVEEDENKITHFILDLSFCSFVDNDGAKTIKALYVAFEKLGVNFHLASCNAGVRRAISTLCEEKRPLYFTSVQKAMQFVKSDFRIDDEITQNEQEDETIFDTRL